MITEIIESREQEWILNVPDGVTGRFIHFNDLPADNDEPCIVIIDSAESVDQVIAAKNRGAVAFVALEGTNFNHGAISAREYYLPMIFSKDLELSGLLNQRVTLGADGDLGLERDIRFSKEVLPCPNVNTPVSVNLGDTNAIEKFPQILDYITHIGFVRIEFMLLDILNGLHPGEYMKRFGENQLVGKLADKLRVLAETGKEVWIRTDDFTHNMLASLEGGGEREVMEKYSVMGERGIRMSISNHSMVRYQFKAIKKLVDEDMKNLGIFPPMTTTPDELIQWQAMAKSEGISREKVKFGLMVETVAVSMTLDLFEDIDFVMIGSNDLTQFIMAVDRELDSLSHLYSAGQPAVIRLIKKIVRECVQKQIPCFIGGVAASNPEDLQTLLDKTKEDGPLYFSVNPDPRTLSATLAALAGAEQSL